MTTKRKKAIERLNGAGDVYQEESPIVKVRYSLVVSQDVLIVQTFGGTSQMEGNTSARGVLTVLDGARKPLETGGTFILVLEDGRRMKFLVRKYDHLANTYQIVRTGGWMVNENSQQ